MAKLKKGIYTEKQKKGSLVRKLQIRGVLRTKNAQRLKKSDEAHRQAQMDLLKLRNI